MENYGHKENERKLLKYHGDENVLYMPIVFKYKNGNYSDEELLKCRRLYMKMTVDGKNNNWKSHCS